MDDARTTARLEEEVALYLATGDSDPAGLGFADGVIESVRRYDRRLREALLAEVRCRERGCSEVRLPPGLDPSSLTRQRVEPMIKGLFPASERQIVLGVAERSIQFLTRETTHHAILEASFPHTAWTIANIYLVSLGLPGLATGGDAPLGFNEGTTCYVSLAYFERKDPFADYVVHEVAHVFHNCKRARLGLPDSRLREWLVNLSFSKRETFAYACEVYSRILAKAHDPGVRATQLAQYAQQMAVGDKRVDQTELLDILAEAIKARNGWKRILARCSDQSGCRATA